MTRTPTRTTVALAVLLVAGGVGGVAPVTADDPIRQTITASLDDGSPVATVAYDPPESVTSLTVRVPALTAPDADVTVVSTSNLRRTDEGAFEWTRSGPPRLTLGFDPDAGRVVTGTGWALVVRPGTRTSYGFRGADPGVETTYDVDGTGIAAGSLAYLGPHRTETVTAGGERTTFVVADAAEPNLTPAREFLRDAPGRFDLGTRRDRTTAFVLPESAAGRPDVAGATAATSFWVRTPDAELRTTDTAFTHEYVHTRLGRTGEDSALWLTEGAAQYFGHVFALNAGAGTYEGFRRRVRGEGLAPDRTAVTLSNPDSWRGNAGNYYKGAHVLAALDAEIRERTDGSATLATVFVNREEPFTDHEDFRRAVVSVSDAPGLADWLDRYLTTDALPPLPDDPSAFVYGPGLDPDGDGVSSGEERARGTNPFAAPTPTPTPTPSPTLTPTTTSTPAEPSETTARAVTAGDGVGPGAAGAALALVATAVLALARQD